MKRIGILLLLVFMLTGCARAEKLPACRVVTGVQVEFQHNGRLLRRHYTKTENVQAMLNYLRILKPYGPVIPKAGSGDGCRITLHFSHGPDSVYLQQGQRYLQKDGGDWEHIDPSRASLLYPLLLLLPSDGELEIVREQ